MNIAQALKEKNRKVALITKLIQRMQVSNVAEEKEEKPYSSKETLKKLQEEIEALVALKTAIHAASAPVRDKIFRLSELKSFIANIEHMQTTEGAIRNRTTGEIIGKKVAEISTKDHEAFLEDLGSKIDKIQEELDAFNHTTSI